jgi:hypothetical protein
MKKFITCAALLVVAFAFPASRARAQAKPKPFEPPKPLPKLVFEREVFEYPGASRRDPFRPLTDNDTQGPLFSEIVLSGIIVQQDPSQSLVMFHDTNKKEYRLHRGDRVGNITVLDITRSSVVFSVEEFGMKRKEVLEMSRAGANK